MRVLQVILPYVYKQNHQAKVSPGSSGRVTRYPVVVAAAVVGVTGELPGIVDLLVSPEDGLA